MPIASAATTLGIAGIAGTLVAALLGASSSLWIERLKGDREAAADKREATVAARAVLSELTFRESEYNVVADGEAAPPGGLVRGDEEWDGGKAVLLAHLDNDEFEAIHLAYVRMAICRRTYPQYYEIAPPHSSPLPVDHGFRKALASALEAIAAARTATRRLSGIPGVAPQEPESAGPQTAAGSPQI